MTSVVPPHDTPRRLRALVGTLARLGVALSVAGGEAEADMLLDQMEAVTACIADAAANDFDDLRAKLALLGQRLEEQLSVVHPGEALTIALAASLLRDLDSLTG
ncbi:MAG: hypothetical protein IT556_17405 [Acetobacteraceae bacterium]|nr:hypothetical protein [Acetobacteraceae bacterium]